MKLTLAITLKAKRDELEQIAGLLKMVEQLNLGFGVPPFVALQNVVALMTAGEKE